MNKVCVGSKWNVFYSLYNDNNNYMKIGTLIKYMNTHRRSNDKNSLAAAAAVVVIIVIVVEVTVAVAVVEVVVVVIV